MAIYLKGIRRDVDFSRVFSQINFDIIPKTDNTSNIGRIDKRWRDIHCGNNLVIDGDLTVKGTTTTIDSSVLTVDDKNIELASTPTPSDALADGGGIILKGTTDKTILWKNATDSWDFNQPIRTGNLELNGNTISSTDTNGDILLSPNGTGRLEIDGNVKCDIVIDDTAYVQLSSSVNQEPADTSPTVITYNTQDAISGITHSTTVNPGELTIVTAGTYFISPQPQVGKASGGLKVDFDMFLQVDRGSGFVDEPNSNIKLTIKDPDVTDVIILAFTLQLNAGDKIRLMQRISSSTVGMGLKNTDPVVGPPTVPRTPSIIFTMYRVGGIAA